MFIIHSFKSVKYLVRKRPKQHECKNISEVHSEVTGAGVKDKIAWNCNCSASILTFYCFLKVNKSKENDKFQAFSRRGRLFPKLTEVQPSINDIFWPDVCVRFSVVLMVGMLVSRACVGLAAHRALGKTKLLIILVERAVFHLIVAYCLQIFIFLFRNWLFQWWKSINTPKRYSTIRNPPRKRNPWFYSVNPFRNNIHTEVWCSSAGNFLNFLYQNWNLILKAITNFGISGTSLD